MVYTERPLEGDVERMAKLNPYVTRNRYVTRDRYTRKSRERAESGTDHVKDHVGIACRALGLGVPADVVPKDKKAGYHHLGTFRIEDADPSVVDYVINQVPTAWDRLSERIPVLVPEKARERHTYVVGATGYGKSEILKVLLHSYSAERQHGAVVVLDPSGDFIEEVAMMKELVGSNRLVYVKQGLEQGMTITINPFEISGVTAEDSSDEAVDVKRVVAQQLVNALQEVIAGGAGSELTKQMRAILMP